VSFYLEPKEPMYGTRARIEWVKSFITKEHTIVDLGCGTGTMMTIPLVAQGYKIVGVDLDEKSIEYGKNVCRKAQLNSDCLMCCNFQSMGMAPDVVIMSQVLEHLSDENLENLLLIIFKKIKRGGFLLVTVPNGYGAYET